MKLSVREEDFEKFNITDEQFGPVMLSRLGKGLYKNPLHCVREYVQNAVDGINKFSNECPNDLIDKAIRIQAEGDTITFHDNGIGMNCEDILTAISFGVSLKEKKYDAGFLGIGIFSGAAIADKLRIYTTKKGETKGLVFEIDFKYIEEHYKEYRSGLQLLEAATRFQEVDEGESNHYCEAILYVNKDYQYLLKDDAEIRRYISNTCPVDFPDEFEYKSAIVGSYEKYGIIEDQIFDIRLNKTPVYRPYPTGVEKPEFKEVRYKDKLLAVYWYCENKEKGFILSGKTEEDVDVNDIRYITYRWRNFLVDDLNRRDYAARELFGGRPDLMKRYFGDIHILELENIEPDLERTGIRYTDEYIRFKKAITNTKDPNNILLLRREAYTKSSQSALVKEAHDAKETVEELTSGKVVKMNEEELWTTKHELKKRKADIGRRKRRGNTYEKLTTPEKKGVDESSKEIEQKVKEIEEQIAERGKDKTELHEARFDTTIKIEIGDVLKILENRLKNHGILYNAILKDLEELVKGE